MLQNLLSLSRRSRSAWVMWFVVLLCFSHISTEHHTTADTLNLVAESAIPARRATPGQLEELHSDLEIWLLLNNADADKVMYQPSSRCPPSFSSTGGGCLRALLPARPGDLVLSVPRALILTAESDVGSPGARALLASSPSRQAFYAANMGVMYLHVLLAESLHSASTRDASAATAVFFSPLLALFLKAFPAHLFPLFWPERDLAHLQGSDMLTFIDMHRQTIDSEYQCIAEDYPAFSTLCSPQLYALIWVYVRANAFTLPATGSPADKTVGLAPLLDAIGHMSEDAPGGTGDGREGSWRDSASGGRDRAARVTGTVDIAFNDEKQAYEVRAADSIAVGAVLAKPLAHISSHKQLLTFGNCDAGPLFFWDQLQPHHPREAFFLHVMRLLLAAARLQGAEDKAWDWDRLGRLYGPVLWELANEQQGADSPPAAFPASTKEARTLLLDIEQTCLQYLSGYHSSLDADMQRLAHADRAPAAVSTNEIHALRLVRTEKRALHHLLSFARLSLEVLHAPSTSALQSRLHRAIASSDQLVGGFLELVVAPLTSAGLGQSEEVWSPAQQEEAGESAANDFTTGEQQPHHQGEKNGDQQQDQNEHHDNTGKVLTVEEFRAQYDVCVEEWDACEDVLVEVDVGLHAEGAGGSGAATLYRLLMDDHLPRAAQWPRLQQ